MKPLNPTFVALALLALSASALSAPALSAPSAVEIVTKSIERRQVRNAIQTMTMVIEDVRKDGSVRSGKPRVLETKVRDDDGVVRSYIRFQAPADMVGIQFVSISPASGDTEQFLYYPPPDELFTRIGGSGRSGRFFGSDFTFEDMEISGSDDATHTLDGEEQITVGSTSIKCWKITSVPTPEAKSQYGKLVSWIEQETYMPRKVEFYDRKDRPLKRMTIETITKEGEVWVPTSTLMEGLQRSTRTRLTVDSSRTNVPASELPLELFTEAYLRSQG